MMKEKSRRSVNFKDGILLCEYHMGAVMDYDHYDDDEVDFGVGSSMKESCCMPVAASDIWYQYNDLQSMKRRAMALARKESSNRYGLGSLLTNSYGCVSSTDTGASSSSKSVDIATAVSSKTQDVLIKWALHASSRRGLERFVNADYNAKRSDIRRRTIKSVIRAQRKMKEEGSDTNVDYSTKVLSRLSEAFSFDSRIFALRMGLADEFAEYGVFTDAVSARTESVPTTVTNFLSEAPPKSDCVEAGSDDDSVQLLKPGMSSSDAKSLLDVVIVEDDEVDGELEGDDIVRNVRKQSLSLTSGSPNSVLRVPAAATIAGVATSSAAGARHKPQPFLTSSSRRNLGLMGHRSNTNSSTSILRSTNDLRHYC